ncbi:MAG TPA: hypothetical protein VFE53_07900 [Mucilaginibacter sp.]|jgi:hypothetical protein|nr:hypothetical protein [Mucilaginibacter sp.]
MKKIFITIGTMTPLLSQAQGKTDYQFNPEQLILNTMIVLLFYFAGTFILAMVKTRMDFRIKSKLLDKGVPDEVASRFLQPEEQDVKHQVFKWFLILAGISTGLALTYYTQPVGIHSAAIIVFCIALSFLAYYFFLKKTSR